MLPPEYRVPVGAVGTLADRVCDLLTDPERLRAARLWARGRVASFDWERVAMDTSRVYLDQQASRRARSASRHHRLALRRRSGEYKCTVMGDLLQYVPHAFGWKAMNIPFVAWALTRKVRQRDDVRVTLHEVSFPWFRQPLHNDVLAAVYRVMAAVLVRACTRAYVRSAPGQPTGRRGLFWGSPFSESCVEVGDGYEWLSVVVSEVPACPSKRRRKDDLDSLGDSDGRVPAAARRGERLHSAGGRGACRGGRRGDSVRTAPRSRPGLGLPRGPGPSAAGPVRPPWPPLARPGAGPRSTGPDLGPIRPPCVRAEGDEPPVRRLGRRPGPAGGPGLGDVPRGGVPVRPPAAPAQPIGHRQPDHGPGHRRGGRPGAGLDPGLESACWPESARGRGMASGCRSPAMWPPTADPGAVAAARSRHAPDPAAPLVGHFGTFGRSITDLLEPAVVGLLRSEPLARVLFIGRGSERYLVDIVAAYPELAGRVSATGELSPAAVAAHLRACDLLLQPYADGVSSRRTSVMAGLANRVPVVTNLGPCPSRSGRRRPGPRSFPARTPRHSPPQRSRFSPSRPKAGLPWVLAERSCISSEFALERTIARLRDPRCAHIRLARQDVICDQAKSFSERRVSDAPPPRNPD